MRRWIRWRVVCRVREGICLWQQSFWLKFACNKCRVDIRIPAYGQKSINLIQATSENKNDGNDLALPNSFMEKKARNIHNTKLGDERRCHSLMEKFGISPSLHAESLFILRSLIFSLQGRSDSSKANTGPVLHLAKWGGEWVPRIAIATGPWGGA